MPFVLLDIGALAGADIGARMALPDDAHHHLTRVLRLRDGDQLEVADGTGPTATALLAGAEVEVASPLHLAPRVGPRVHVVQALGKARKHDEVVRALTELGVDRISGVTSERTLVELTGERAGKARVRWAAVARAACEQARRPELPTTDGPEPLEHVLGELGQDPCLVADPGGTADPLEAARSVADAGRVVLAVGPEGGWTDDERETFHDVGAIRVGLGRSVLRTEHAATVLAAIVLAATGRMRP